MEVVPVLIQSIISFIVGGGIVGILGQRYVNQKLKAEARREESTANSVEADIAQKMSQLYGMYTEEHERFFKKKEEDFLSKIDEYDERLSQYKEELENQRQVNKEQKKVYDDQIRQYKEELANQKREYELQIQGYREELSSLRKDLAEKIKTIEVLTTRLTDLSRRIEKTPKNSKSSGDKDIDINKIKDRNEQIDPEDLLRDGESGVSSS